MSEDNGHRPHRSRMEITANILEIARDGSRKTRIMYLANLSFDLLQKYIDLLVNHGLLEIRNEPAKTYFATEKGHQFLNDFNELQKYAEIAASKKTALDKSLAPLEIRY
jgi:predicted transcriptional regulator